MFFPLNILESKVNIFPLFKNQLVGNPYIFDFSSKSKNLEKYSAENFELFQKNIFNEMDLNNAKWGIGRYLEDREKLLSPFPQFLEEKRFYHLGLDIVVPADYFLYSPLDSKVYKIGFDSGFRNYGGFVILQHEINETVFYSFYGHLKTDFFIKEGDHLKQGEQFAQIGEKADSGEWFTHTHLQILTQKAVDENLITKGYESESNLKYIDEYFPSPYFLFRY